MKKAMTLLLAAALFALVCGAVFAQSAAGINPALVGRWLPTEAGSAMDNLSIESDGTYDKLDTKLSRNGETFAWQREQGKVTVSGTELVFTPEVQADGVGEAMSLGRPIHEYRLNKADQEKARYKAAYKLSGDFLKVGFLVYEKEEEWGL